MFNKSILAAALLTVGTIAGGSAVSAAEIGVQSTWGHSNTAITNGEFRSESTSVSAYAERSRVDVLGWNSFEESEVTSGVAAPGQEYVLVEDLAVSEREVDVDPSYDFKGFKNPKGGQDVQTVSVLDGGLEGLAVREGESTTSTNELASGGQLSWARAARVELGGSFSRATDNYDYTGTRTSGFSGTTAFTR